MSQLSVNEYVDKKKLKSVDLFYFIKLSNVTLTSRLTLEGPGDRYACLVTGEF